MPFIAKLLTGWVSQFSRQICEGIIGAIPSGTGTIVIIPNSLQCPLEIRLKPTLYRSKAFDWDFFKDINLLYD